MKKVSLPVVVFDGLSVHAVVEPETAVPLLPHPGLDISGGSTGLFGLVGEVVGDAIVIGPGVFILFGIVVNLESPQDS